MHHALEIQEILLNIFVHCRLPCPGTDRSDLPALARTCRAFEEPALDVLWGNLVNPSPLARCLPEASHRRQLSSGDKCYSFRRSLTRTEWSILRSYTRRILSIADCEHGLDWQSVRTFLNPPPNDPLFPSLRHLYAGQSTEVKHLLNMPFPSMISLFVDLVGEKNLRVLQGSLESFSKFSPKIRRLSINLHQSDITFNNFFPSHVWRWRNLETLDCAQIALNMDDLAHLSRIHTLTRLTFMPTDALHPRDSPLCFTNLHDLRLYSESLHPISLFLSQTRLPVTTNFSAFITSRPSKLDFSSFLASMKTSGIAHVIKELQLNQGSINSIEDPKPTLSSEDLRPCTAFSNLRRIDLDLEWQVDLTESELLALASAWPRLQCFLINMQWGWNTPGGITPNGLIQLLRTCRSLTRIALALDTRGYTEIPRSPANLALTLPPKLSLNVVDSVIEVESTLAIAAFLVGIALDSDISLRAWRGSFMEESEYPDRWNDVWELVEDSIKQRS
ncbi:hypothetical protein EV363DRAFT_1445617 [Boletus edulis]|nr:hypothetical protein EV363DRAFT_1445617 [Boletus edulis]